MSDEPSARSIAPPALAAPDEYDAICAVLTQTERGRWFLQEYVRRSRSADTQLLLGALRRIERVVRADRSARIRQGFRSDLLEMAQAITRTRAEVADIKPAAVSGWETPRPDGPEPSIREAADSAAIFASAERIREVTWAMRGHGFDPSTCDELEDLAGSILSASSLRDPTDRRAHKLAEVLQYLEHRIDAILESSAAGDSGRDGGAADADLSPWPDWPANLAPNPPASEVLRLPPQPSISLLTGPERGGDAGEPSGERQAVPAPAALEAGPAAGGAPPPLASDPLAPIKAMSEAERIALFT
jgi:hypothetical protein